MSDVRYEIKLRYLYLTETLTEKSGFGPYVTNNFLCERFDKQVSPWEVRQVLILVDLVEVEELRVHELGLVSNEIARSKEWNNINTHPIDRSSLYLLYIGLAIEHWALHFIKSF